MLMLADRLSHRERRALDARADRAFERLNGAFLDADPAADWVFLEEDRVRVISSDHAPAVLAAFGLAGSFDELESRRSSRPFGWMPAVVIIGGHAAVRPGGVCLVSEREAR